MEVHGTWNGGFETQLDDDRGHRVTIDLPVDEGGRDVGTSALELGMQSVAGCIITIFCLIAQRRQLSFTRLSLHLTVERSEGAPTVERVQGRLKVGTSASKDDVETALRLTLSTCPMGVLLTRADVPVEVTAEVLPK